MYGNFQKFLSDELASIEAAGLYKKERNIASAQSAEITLEDGSKALNFCANNYLIVEQIPGYVKRYIDDVGVIVVLLQLEDA